VGDQVGVAVGVAVGLQVGDQVDVPVPVQVGLDVGVALKVGVSLGVALGVGVEDSIKTALESAQLLGTAQRPLASVPKAEALKLTVPGKRVLKTHWKIPLAPPVRERPDGAGPLARPTAPLPVAVSPCGVTLRAEAWP
jgi:hypothetical protein